MDGGKYLEDGPSRLQRALSLAVVVIWFVVILEFSGTRSSVRYLVPSFLALACIWFPAAMTKFQWSRNFPAEPSHTKILLAAAWFFIALVPLIAVVVRWSLG